MIVVGTVSAYAAIGIRDPYYSLPSIPIAILAFSSAAILFVSALSPRKNRVWLYLGTCVVVLFTCSSFAVVAQDYTVRQEKVAGGLRLVGDVYVTKIQHIDQEIAQFEMRVSIYNYTDSEATIDKIDFDLYCEGPDGVWYLALHDQWAPAMIIGARKFAETGTTVSIKDVELLSKIYEQVAIKKRGLGLKINGSIWFDTEGGAVEVPFQSAGSCAWYPPP